MFNALATHCLASSSLVDETGLGRMLAVCVLICIALCVWMFKVGMDPKQWRMRWMDLFGLLDADTPREQRLMQEGQLRFAAYVLIFLFGALSLSCAFWSIDQLRDSLRRKTSIERDLNYLKREVDEIKGRR